MERWIPSRSNKSCLPDLSLDGIAAITRSPAGASKSTHLPMNWPTGSLSAAARQALTPPHIPCPMTTMLETFKPMEAYSMAADVPW